MERADEEQQAAIDPAAVQAALDNLKRHPEPEAGFMKVAGTIAPAYNVQTAGDTEHALIVTQQVTTQATDNRSLLPMAEAAGRELVEPAGVYVVADAGYSNGEQADRCEQQGIVRHVPRD